MPASVPAWPAALHTTLACVRAALLTAGVKWHQCRAC